MTADNFNPHAANDTEKYVLSAGRIARRITTKDGFVCLPLCNFSARIRDEVASDDGEQVQRLLTIEGATADGRPLPIARVDAAQFAGMRWVAAHWGSHAIIDAGQGAQDHLRAAIQYLSQDAATRRVYTHTGWRILDGRLVFLTSNGASGAEQVVVDLPREMERYRLPLTPTDPSGAMQASLRLLALAPPAVTVPLWASMFLAPLSELVPPKFTLWLYGMTGGLKSTLAALALSHYGDWSPDHLVMWSATANALEKYLFLAKDVPFVVDDYAPQSDRDMAGRQDAVVERLVRDAGNRTGRARMGSDFSLLAVHRPRGLLLSTGEQLPAGQSLLARLVMVELRPGDVDLAALGAAQAERSLYPHAMSAYIAWLAGQWDTLRASLPLALERHRKAARAEGQQHLRLPESLATLFVAWELAWRFALELGATDASTVEHWRVEGWCTLMSIGRRQQKQLVDERPTVRFLRILGEMLARQKVFFTELTGTQGKAAGRWLGWRDDAHVYLLPGITYHAVVQYARDEGHSFTTSEHALRKALAEDGLSVGDPGRLTRSLRVGVPNHTQRVLQLRRAGVDRYLNSR
jgi:Domain of unknown function (DUF927)